MATEERERDKHLLLRQLRHQSCPEQAFSTVKKLWSESVQEAVFRGMTLNKRRKYSNIKQFNDCCATALHVASDRWVESLGATVRTGGEIDFIVCNPQQKIDK